MLRKIVRIDPDKCNGCGDCVPSCAEGAITIINGKAVLAAENLCDGLGACLGECPMDAITVEEREADEFDEVAVEKHLSAQGKPVPAHASQPAAPQHHAGGGCPGSRAMSFDRPQESAAAAVTGSRQSQLAQWPVQLHLVSTTASYFQGADLLITADCVPFAYADYHQEFLKGKAVVETRCSWTGHWANWLRRLPAGADADVSGAGAKLMAREPGQPPPAWCW